MKKSTRIIIVAICIFVVGLTFYLIFDMQKQLSERASTNVVSENKIKENTVNRVNNTQNIVNEIEQNVILNNVVSENTVNNSEVEENDMQESFEKEGNQQLAIELVKEKWGDTSSVYLTNEGINDDGEYLVAVRGKDSTAIIASFRVDIKNKKVNIDL